LTIPIYSLCCQTTTEGKCASISKWEPILYHYCSKREKIEGVTDERVTVARGDRFTHERVTVARGDRFTHERVTVARGDRLTDYRGDRLTDYRGDRLTD